jgi:stage II sporulation protein D
MKKLLLSLTLILALGAECRADVKVLLSAPKTAAEIKVSGPFTIKDLYDGKKYSLKKGGSFKISKQGKTLQIGTLRTAKGAEISLNKNTDYFTVAGSRYRGPVIITPYASGFYIVERTGLENYLYGVLPYEMSPNWPIEALKAQAVAARTFTLKSIEGKKNNAFQLYSDTRSQVYKGSVEIHDSVRKAVDGTKGMVLKYKGNLFYTYYHANCGGHTSPSLDPKEDIKPLSGVKCGYCKDSAQSKWKYKLDETTMNSYLVKNKIPGKIKGVKVGKKQPGGRAVTLILETTKTKHEVNCNTMRLAIGADRLKSCLITKTKGLNLEGRGYGHGRGLCQEGAKGMAKAGKNYKQIVAHFYPGSKLAKI